MSNQLLNELTFFVLAIFVGIEVISKVPTILHTPLMSGTNAIHGIVIVGGLLTVGALAGGCAIVAERVHVEVAVRAQRSGVSVVEEGHRDAVRAGRPIT